MGAGSLVRDRQSEQALLLEPARGGPCTATWPCSRPRPGPAGAGVPGRRQDYATISAVLDMPVGSIGPTRKRGLEKMRTLLEAADHWRLVETA